MTSENRYKAKHVRTGLAGEAFVKAYLEDLGYECSYPDESFSGDLIVFDPMAGVTFKLEIKSARPNINDKYNFCIYRANKTDCSYSDMVALVFIGRRKKIEVRFLPCSKVRGMKNLVIGKHPQEYTGKWSKEWLNSLPLEVPNLAPI